MLHAIENQTSATSPTTIAAVAAAAGLVGLLALASVQQATVVRRLVLHAPKAPDAFYLTAWHHGDLLVRVPSGDLRPLTFEVRALVSDGCEWLATERLQPAGGDVYTYSYSEEIVACEPGSTPALKTPRTGIVIASPPSSD